MNLQVSRVYQFQVMAILQLFAGMSIPMPPPEMLGAEDGWEEELIVIEGVVDMDIDVDISITKV